MTSSRQSALSLVALAGTALLFAGPQAQAASPGSQITFQRSAQANQILREEQFINQLLGRTQAVIRRDAGLIARQDRLVARQTFLAGLNPINPRQARAISFQLLRIGHQIISINNILAPDKVRLSNLVNLTNASLNHLATIQPQNAHQAAQLSRFFARTDPRAAQLASLAEQIIVRPLATPFVPTSF
jgi:hypothetical protein